MNTVDLSQAKAGDVVHFRCGGSAKVRRIYQKIFRKRYWFVDICASTPDYQYLKTGVICPVINVDDHPFDIVKVESK